MEIALGNNEEPKGKVFLFLPSFFFLFKLDRAHSLSFIFLLMIGLMMVEGNTNRKTALLDEGAEGEEEAEEDAEEEEEEEEEEEVEEKGKKLKRRRRSRMMRMKGVA